MESSNLNCKISNNLYSSNIINNQNNIIIKEGENNNKINMEKKTNGNNNQNTEHKESSNSSSINKKQSIKPFEEEGVYENDIHDLKVEYSPYEIEISKNPKAVSDKYEELMKKSNDPNTREDFYKELAKDLSWSKFPSVILDSSNPPFYRWYADGEMNACYNCIDKHVKEGRGKSTAIITYSCYTKHNIEVSYEELLKNVSKTADMLINNGVKKGDTVIIYMPMIAESIYSMLACARIGAIHSVVFGGFSAEELSDRILDAVPNAIITASCGIEPRKKVIYWNIIREALELAKSKNKESLKKELVILFYQREDVYIEEFINKNNSSDKDIYNIKDFQTEFNKGKDFVECVNVDANHPLYILYTSGTTGTPKGIVRGTAGQMVMINWQMANVMDIDANDCYFSTSDIGWVVGHCFIVYGPLVRGCSTIVFEGKPVGTPNPGIYWELVQKYKVKSMYTAPTAIRAIIREDSDFKYLKKWDVSSLKSITMAGERCDPNTISWLQKAFGSTCLINDNYWQTETGYGICANNIRIHTFPVFPGSTTKPLPGNDMIIYDYDTKKEIHEKNHLGSVYAKLPLSPAFMLTLWKNEEFFKKKYISKDNQYYITGDAGYFDSNGYFHILTRLDDVINVAGHRLSTGRIEEVLIKVEGVVEAAVVSIHDDLKLEIPFAFIVLKSDIIEKEKQEMIRKACMTSIVEHIGAISRLKDCVIVKKLPKTRSGKILRATIKKILNKEDFKIPSTIEDLSVLEEIKEILFGNQK